MPRPARRRRAPWRRWPAETQDTFLSAKPAQRNQDDSARIASLDQSREAITYYRPMEDRESDWAPLSARLIARMFTYTRRYQSRRNWLFVLTFVRGLQLPALAWMIGWTINGPIAGRDLRGIYVHALGYLGLV